MTHQERQAGKPTEDGQNDAAALHTLAPQLPAKPAPKVRPSLAIPIPLEDGYLAQLVIPRDLGRKEMLRLRRVLLSLAVPWRA